MTDSDKRILKIVKWVTGIALVLLLVGMWAIPQWNVWQRELSGKATLAEAQWSRKVAIEEAQAKFEAAKHLAAAEVERARGVAEANKIIGESLKENESYLRYLWILGLQDGSSEVIYIPTEANMPILEATRLLRPTPKPKADAPKEKK